MEQRYNIEAKVSAKRERMLSVCDLTVFAKMLQCHQMPMNSQEMTEFRYYPVTLILDL
ncbi:MAG: hypothetical protein IJD84_08375 [Parabacteroides sp.]|nr:hypothetical protein [Parabacteroides sp.]